MIPFTNNHPNSTQLNSPSISLYDIIGTLKAAQPANKVENGSTNITAADVTQLMDKLSTMTAEVDLSNKRAVEAERRVSDLAKDKTQLTDEQIPMLKLKLERKKEKNKALCSKLVELEQVGKEYYAELQVSLNQNSTYEAQCSDLRVRLERAEKEKDSRIAGQSTKEQTGPTEGHGQLLAAHEELQNNFNNLQDRYRRAREELEDEEIDNKRTQVSQSQSLFLYTVGILCNVECCIRQLWCSSTIFYHIISIAYNHQTDLPSFKHTYLPVTARQRVYGSSNRCRS